MGLVGESGSGKTTLGRLAVGLAPLSAGSVHLDGVDLWPRHPATRPARLRSGLAIVHQDPAASLDPRLLGRAEHPGAPRHRRDQHPERAGRPGPGAARGGAPAASYAERRPHELSGGQRQRIALARALVNRPSLVVADEPTSALDVSVQATVLELFRELQTELSFACLFISHDLAVVHRVADRVVVLRRGEIVESGDADRVLTAPEHEYTRALVGAVPRVQHLRVPAQEL